MTQAVRKPRKPDPEESLFRIALDEIPRATRAFFAPVIGARIVLRALISERSERERAAAERRAADRAA